MFGKLADKIYGKPQIVTPKFEIHGKSQTETPKSELQFTDENTKKWYMALLNFIRSKEISIIRNGDGVRFLKNKNGRGCGRLIIRDDMVGVEFPRDSTDYTAGSLKVTSRTEPDIEQAMAYLEQKLDY